MKRALLMPKLGLTMTEGLLAEWTLSPGDSFVAGQTVFVVESDKTANEIAAEEAGTLLEIVHPVGTTVDVGVVVGHWDDGRAATQQGAAQPDAAAAASPTPEARAGSAVPAPDQPAPAAARGAGTVRVPSTPLARRLAREAGIGLDGVAGRGPGGRIEAADVTAAAAAAAPAAPVAAANQAAATLPLPGRRIEPGRIALATARRLVQAKQQIPHFYLSTEADMGALQVLRADMKAAGGSAVTINTVILAAVARALLDLPEANRVWDDDAYLQYDGSDVGMAVHTDQGLYAPVLRDAGKLGLAELGHAARRLAERARAGQLGAADLSGGAITVSNAGMFDVTTMASIINPGQAMILGVGSMRAVFRPDAAGAPVLRHEMGLTLACDHRLLDGVSGLRFLRRVVHNLHTPEGLV